MWLLPSSLIQNFNMKSHRTSLVTVIILGILVVALLGAWIFFGYKASSYKKEIALLATEAKNKSALDAYLSSVRNALRDSKSDLAIIKSQFITKDEIPEFINLLESKASKSGVRADFSSININTDETSREVLKIKITGTGDWNNVTDFISTLDSLPYASHIGSINLNKISGAPQDKTIALTWGFSMELSQYLETKI
jgi:Tfp pilus assembly protein PilO